MESGKERRKRESHDSLVGKGRPSGAGIPLGSQGGREEGREKSAAFLAQSSCPPEKHSHLSLQSRFWTLAENTPVFSLMPDVRKLPMGVLVGSAGC